MDLRDLFTGGTTPRLVLQLVENLPPHYRSSAILRDDEGSYGWRNETYLVAAVVNAVQEGTFANMQVRTKKKLPSPERLKVPGAEEKKSKPANAFVQMAQAQLASAQRS